MIDTFYRVRTDSDPPEPNSISRGLIHVNGESPDFIAKRCRGDISNLVAGGVIGVGSFVFNTTIFSAIGTHLYGSFNPGVAITAAGLAGIVLANDSYVSRSLHLPSGFEQLQQSGL